ncbi:serpentine type 7TM GPCR chemoreceptor srx domain-containing protein [Ditylenchus destructor]|uniref:Serpentine type 7TM GPCR chemoreceptor srx domain-containing protein n=1 Tax=Ditylenchus destructor TaxID=166010 RepID=A0AAD4N8M4_9BILA|nr:serpentine type 7TM GPCR chemoreceptor srx domain-containing protein [Ditylenchus destructor]
MTCYRIMLSISVLEAIQLLCHGLMSLVVVLDIELVGFFASLMGAAVVSSWICMIPQHVLLAFNRLLVLSDISGRENSNKRTFNILLLICWLWGILYFVVLQTPMCKITFISEPSAFEYEANETLSNVISLMDIVVMVASPIACLILYFVIVCKIVKHRRRFFEHSSQRWANNSAPANAKILAGAELRLLLQAFLGFALIGLLILANYSLGLLFPITSTTLTAIYALWIACCTFSSIFYLIINKILRRRAIALLFHCAKQNDGFSNKTHGSATPKTFVAYADYRKTMCIRMMLSISVLEAIQLSCHFLMSLAVIFDVKLVGWTATIIGAAVLSSWYAMLPQHTLLALNRFLILGDMYGRGARNRYSSIIFNILLSVCWFWGFSYFALMQTPLSRISFIPQWSTFQYNYEKTFGKITKILGMVNTAGSPTICLGIYLIILYKLVRHRRRFSKHSSDRWVNTVCNSSEAPKLMNAAELRLLLQAFLGFLLIELNIAVNYLLNMSVIPISPNILCAIYGIWITCCTFSSILYLVINKTLRRRAFLLLFRWSKENDSSTITVSHISVTQKVTMRPRAVTS